MKRLLKNLSLLTMGLVIFSCNEKVSPELQNGGSTTAPTVVTPSTYYFGVTNTSPTVLNYVLHRTGNGRASSPCKVSQEGTALSSSLFLGEGNSGMAHDNKVYDISCYFEAEELSLFYNGLSFQVEASKNTCDYIGYSPFSYFDKIPGSSTGNYVGVKCGDLITNFHAAPFATAIGAVYGAGLTPVGCGQMVDLSVLPISARVPRPIPTETADYCAYDYTESEGPNCDTGTIRMSITDVTNVAPEGDPVDPQGVAQQPTSTPCGGKVVNCIGGAIKEVGSLAGFTRGTEIMRNELNEDFAKEYKLPALIGVKPGNFDIANYRRSLASTNLNFRDFTPANDANWFHATYSKTFDPTLMDKYADNRYPDNTAIISGAAATARAQINGWSSFQFAAEPFLSVTSAYRVNPFYTFYCMDRAYEIKARIRMVVRDWDRVFSSDVSQLELVSDAYLPLPPTGGRRMDLPSTEEEIPNDPGYYNVYNDRNDFDNIVPMTRTNTAVYTPGVTLWQPTAGWWGVGLFPNQD